MSGPWAINTSGGTSWNATSPGPLEPNSAPAERRLVDAVATVRAGGIPLVYLGATFIPEEETSFAQFQGMLEGVDRACRLAGLSFARIVQAEEIEP